MDSFCLGGKVFLLLMLLIPRRECLGQTPISSSNRFYSDTPFCWFCNEEEYCRSDGDCCTIPKNNFRNNFLETHGYECVQTKFLSNSTDTNYLDHSNVNFVEKAWMFTKCLSSADSISKELCENQGMQEDLSSIIPVTDSIYHYRNKYCAFCNGIYPSFPLKNWIVEIYCDAEISGNESLILKTVKRRKCNLFYKPPDGVSLQECLKTVEYDSSSSCATTFQKSRTYSPTEPPCEIGGQLILSLANKYHICQYCNTIEHLPQKFNSCITFPELLMVDISPPFTAILDVNAIQQNLEVIRMKCDTTTQFYDDKYLMCREIWCHPYRYLVNGSCAVGKNIKHKLDEKYDIFIELTPVPSTEDGRLSLRKMDFVSPYFQDKVNQLIGNFFPQGAVHDFRIYINSSYHDTYNLVMRIVSNVITGENGTDFIYNLVSGVHNSNLTFLPTIKFHVKFVSFSNYLTSKDTFNVTIRKNKPEALEAIAVIVRSTLQSYNDLKLIPFTKLHICPFIDLNQNELLMRVENDILYLEGKPFDAKFTRWEFMQINGVIRLCVDDYLAIYKTLHIPSVSLFEIYVDTISTKQVLAFFCVCLSILCLLITIITYCLFRQLRSQPGVNNIILCTFLFLAQTVYQFGSGQRSLSDTACALIGGICHFLWLSVMLSMNICSIEMFTVFKELRQLSQRFKWKPTLRNVLYIVGGSLILVVINLASSLYLSDGKHSGYGGSPCYLSSYTMHLITFLIPSAILITINLFLFIYVVFRIKSVTSKSKSVNKKERSYLEIYARLSTLTGLTWLIGFLQSFLDIEPLDYIFIVLNGSQGVFIMIAFVLNRTIYELCSERKFVSSSKDTSMTKVKSSMSQTLNQD